MTLRVCGCIVLLLCGLAAAQPLGVFDSGRAGVIEPSLGVTFAGAQGERGSTAFPGTDRSFRDRATTVDLGLRVWATRGSWVALRFPILVDSSGAQQGQGGGNVDGGELRDRVLGWVIAALASKDAGPVRYGATFQLMGPSPGDVHRDFGIGVGGFVVTTNRRPNLFAALSALVSAPGGPYDCRHNEDSALMLRVGTTVAAGDFLFSLAPRVEHPVHGPRFIPGGEASVAWAIFEPLALSVTGQIRYADSVPWSGWDSDVALTMSYASAIHPGSPVTAGSLPPRYRPVAEGNEFAGCQGD